ncbi:MAG: glycosyltransferase family 4 protein [Sandaracinaceae bacterium]
MKVLHVTRDFPPRVNGGISVAVGGLVRAQRAAGLDVRVASFDGWRPRGPRAAPLPWSEGVWRAAGPDDVPALAREAAAFAPEVVHVHDALLFDALTIETAPRVLTVHVDQHAQRVLRSLDRPTKSELAQAAARAAADVVIVPSRALGEGEVIPFGVDLPATGAGGDALLYVGRLADVKGTAELLEAARRVDAPFQIAGGLPDSPRAERRWREAAPPNAIFLGWLSPEALARAYAGAAMLLAPSWHETFGLAVAEAMSFGVPPIASAVGALPERVTHEVSGLLVPPRDVDALVDAIERLRGDEALRRRLGEGARAAAARWTWAACEAAHRAVYETARGKHSEGAP